MRNRNDVDVIGVGSTSASERQLACIADEAILESMMKRYALGLALVSCGDNAVPPDAPDAFAYRATITWSLGVTPQLVSMTINGQPLRSGEVYIIEHTFASFDDAMANFSPRRVVVVTTSSVQTIQLIPAYCLGLISGGDPVLGEEDNFLALPALGDFTKVRLDAVGGHCRDRQRDLGWEE